MSEALVEVSASLDDMAAEMLAALAMADGELHPREVEVIKAACSDWGIPFVKVERALETFDRSDLRARFIRRACEVPVDDREVLAGILCEVAAADARLHDREAELLSELGRAWKVPIAFTGGALNWDVEQKEVIGAPADAYLLVSAGPGMGKTAVACARVSHLVQSDHLTDTNIWLVSFTRAAVGELKSRIADFSDRSSHAIDVKISTIDSKAWRVRYGFSETQAQKLFGGFDTGIEEAIELMRERPDDFAEAFAGLEHVLVDEAQDITDARARFLIQIIDFLPETCGITVFYDPAQAIYDYARTSEEPFRFVDALKQKLGNRLVEKSLRNIHRTDDPILLRLYEDLRLDILGNENAGLSEFRARQDLVRRAAGGSGKFETRKLAEYANSLVLFRRRVEVAQASSFMAKDGSAHRLRMSNLPIQIEPWLGLVFYKTFEREIDKRKFAEQAKIAFDGFDRSFFKAADVEDFVEVNWPRLRHVGAAGPRSQNVDLWKVRGNLLRGHRDEFALPELGQSGPILGTIHASKGKEADHVVLQIPPSWGSGGENGKNHVEESRVLFVGATRAKERLSVQSGQVIRSAGELNERRCYKSIQKYRNGAQVQFGVDGDQDLRSIAEQGVDLRSIVDAKVPKPCTAWLLENEKRYIVQDDDGRYLGRLSRNVYYDLVKLAKTKCGPRGTPPEEIRNLYVLGYTTVVEPPASQSAEPALCAPFDRSGFWVSPLILGFSLVFCGWKNRWN